MKLKTWASVSLFLRPYSPRGDIGNKSSNQSQSRETGYALWLLILARTALGVTGQADSGVTVSSTLDASVL